MAEQKDPDHPTARPSAIHGQMPFMRNPETKWKTPSLQVAMKPDPYKPVRRCGSSHRSAWPSLSAMQLKKRDFQVPGFYHRSEGSVYTSSEPTLPRRLTRELTSVLPVLELRWVHHSLAAWNKNGDRSLWSEMLYLLSFPIQSERQKKPQLSVPPRERKVELIHCRPAFSRVSPEDWLNFNQSWSSNRSTMVKQSGGEEMAAWASWCHDSPSWITTEYPLTKNTVAWFSLGRQKVVKAPRISVCADPWGLFPV